MYYKLKIKQCNVITLNLSSIQKKKKNTGLACHFLIQGIFLTQGSNLCLLCLMHQQADSLPLSHLGSPYSDNNKPLSINNSLMSQIIGLQTFQPQDSIQSPSFFIEVQLIYKVVLVLSVHLYCLKTIFKIIEDSRELLFM